MLYSGKIFSIIFVVDDLEGIFCIIKYCSFGGKGFKIVCYWYELVVVGWIWKSFIRKLRFEEN